jgi:hypothetical protein
MVKLTKIGNIPKFPSKTKFKLVKSLTTWLTNYYILLLCCTTNYFIPLTLLYVCILLFVCSVICFFFHKTQKEHNNGDNKHDHDNCEHNELSFGS